MLSRTMAQIAASVLLHAGVAGLALAFSSGGLSRDEQVYRVTLAEFAASAASSPSPASPSPAPVPQAETPKPEPAKPEPEIKKPPESKTKTINTRKKIQKTKPKQEEQPSAPVQPASTGAGETAGTGESAGPAGPSLNIGGLAAYGIDAVDQRPSIARRVVPEYPATARRMGVEGKVVVRLVVDAAGKPRECTVHEADPPGYFEDAALAAARRTRFIPGKVRGRPVNTAVLIPFIFVLR